MFNSLYYKDLWYILFWLLAPSHRHPHPLVDSSSWLVVKIRRRKRSDESSKLFMWKISARWTPLCCRWTRFLSQTWTTSAWLPRRCSGSSRTWFPLYVLSSMIISFKAKPRSSDWAENFSIASPQLSERILSCLIYFLVSCEQKSFIMEYESLYSFLYFHKSCCAWMYFYFCHFIIIRCSFLFNLSIKIIPM